MKLLSRVQLFGTPWSVSHQVPPSMGFSRQEYWSGVPLISPIRLWSSYQMTRVPFCSSRRLDALSGGSPQEGLVRWDTGFPWIFWSNSTSFHQNHTLNSSHLGSGVQDFPFSPMRRDQSSQRASGLCGPSPSPLLPRAPRVARGWNFWSAPTPSCPCFSVSPELSPRRGLHSFGWRQAPGASLISAPPTSPPSASVFSSSGRNGPTFPPAVS